MLRYPASQPSGDSLQMRIWGQSLVVPHRSAVDYASTWPTKGLGGAVNAVQYCSKLAAPKDLLIMWYNEGNSPDALVESARLPLSLPRVANIVLVHNSLPGGYL